MAIHEHDVRHHPAEPPVAQLVRELGQDAATLVRQEIALARLELKQTVAGVARDAGLLAGALALAWTGALALLAALVIGLGDLLDNYWLSAFLLSVLLVGAAALLARAGVQHLKRNSLAPRQTIQTLQEDRRWARTEVRDLKRQLKH